MFKMYPNIEIADNDGYALASFLFGHRMRANQTDIEYLIEFLQVMIAEKKLGAIENGDQMRFDYFPLLPDKYNQKIKYMPRKNIGLKRFIFFSHSKPEGKLPVDESAHQACLNLLESKVEGDAMRQRQMVRVLQDLFYGFNATSQNRSWFDKNMLPICPEVILPEGMGVKTERESLTFSLGNKDVDNKFSYTRYTYMCRGGEIYYLHLLSSVNYCGVETKHALEARFKKLLCESYPQFSELSKFIKNAWETYMAIDPSEIEQTEKTLMTIPDTFSCRDRYIASEINTLLSNRIDPFDKLRILADGIVLQLLRVMYETASLHAENRKAMWVLDISRSNSEIRKLATDGFAKNERDIIAYIHKGYAHFERRLKDANRNGGKSKEQKHINDASNDSYKLYRRLAKNLGFLIPPKGANMRLSLNERLVKFVVLCLIGPGKKVTLDMFLEMLYDHFGMVIDRSMYERGITDGHLDVMSDFTFLDENNTAFKRLLKDCGFLRDLSDATCIVENPFDKEAINE